MSSVKGSEELIDGNLTDAVTNIVNGINAVKQNAPQAAQETKTQLHLRIFLFLLFLLMISLKSA